MNSGRSAFGICKPLIGMVHVQGAPSIELGLSLATADAMALKRGGADMILVENWGYGDIGPGLRLAYHTLQEMAGITREVVRMAEMPWGLNLLPLDYRGDFQIAKEVGLVRPCSFVQLDTFVDKEKTDYGGAILDVNPKSIIALRRRMGQGHVKLATNIQTKHYTVIPHNKKLETSARQAIREGADVLVVTGRLTGEKTPLDKILRVRKVAGDVPILIGSGLSVENADELLPHADGAIVGTSLKLGGVTENAVSEAKVSQLARKFEHARRLA